MEIQLIADTNDEITRAWIAAISLIAAAILAAWVHYVWTKAKTISEFRQKWINNLRDELSVFIGLMSAPAPATPYEIARSLARIKLFLNYKEDEHIELLSMVEQLADVFNEYRKAREREVAGEQNAIVDVKHNSDKAGKLINELGNFGQQVLKAEWEETKAMKVFPKYFYLSYWFKRKKNSANGK